MDKEREEKKREKFVELAEKRVSRAIRDIRLIGNLANRANYAYTDEDVRRIIRALQGEVRRLKGRFMNRDGSEDKVFRLR